MSTHRIVERQSEYAADPSAPSDPSAPNDPSAPSGAERLVAEVIVVETPDGHFAFDLPEPLLGAPMEEVRRFVKTEMRMALVAWRRSVREAAARLAAARLAATAVPGVASKRRAVKAVSDDDASEALQGEEGGAA